MKRLLALMGVAIACAIFGALAATGNLSSPVPQSAGGSVHPAGWGGTPKGYVPPAAVSPTVTPSTTMYDSVNVAEIPARPYAAAGYTAGTWPTWYRIRTIATHAISIAIHSTYYAECLDIEPGDATTAQAGPWAVTDIRHGFPRPCQYSDLSNMPAVKASDRAALGPDWRSKVLLWLAWYRRIPGLVTGYDAVQYDPACMGRDLDCSTVSFTFLKSALPPYVEPAPKPPAPPVHTTPAPTPPPPAPPVSSHAVCWGEHATPRSSVCKTVIRRHAWLVDQRIAWGRAFHHCERHASPFSCDHAWRWYEIRRGQAVSLKARYS